MRLMSKETAELTILSKVLDQLRSYGHLSLLIRQFQLVADRHRLCLGPLPDLSERFVDATLLTQDQYLRAVSLGQREFFRQQKTD